MDPSKVAMIPEACNVSARPYMRYAEASRGVAGLGWEGLSKDIGVFLF